MGVSEQDLLDDRIQTVRRRDHRFSRNAYYFVLDALDYTMSRLGKDQLTGEERHVGGKELLYYVQDFAAVYKEAGITLPPHGYGVDRVSEMLQGKRLSSLGREVKATAVLAALEAARVDVQDVIEDGVRRDKALDAFEAAKERELVERKAGNESRVQSLRKDLDELLKKINSEIEKLKQESQQAEAAFAQLQIRKRQEEARLLLFE